ncbi:MAG: MbcA/ParS/Xre antitoxin family protein [Pseudomonadota bacterium]
MDAFSRLAEDWGLSTDEQITLLGSPGRSTFFKWKKSGGNLPHDTIERISHLLGIYKSLQIVLPNPEAADGWIKKPNAFFDDRSALDVMLGGNVVDIYKVREYLDAQRGG